MQKWTQRYQGGEGADGLGDRTRDGVCLCNGLLARIPSHDGRVGPLRRFGGVRPRDDATINLGRDVRQLWTTYIVRTAARSGNCNGLSAGAAESYPSSGYSNEGKWSAVIWTLPCSAMSQNLQQACKRHCVRAKMGTHSWGLLSKWVRSEAGQSRRAVARWWNP